VKGVRRGGCSVNRGYGEVSVFRMGRYVERWGVETGGI
jgi:hypothetical protein